MTKNSCGVPARRPGNSVLPALIQGYRNMFSGIDPAYPDTGVKSWTGFKVSA